MTENAPDSEPGLVQLPVVWAGVEDLPVEMVNAHLIQLDQDSQAVYLTVGIVVAPPVVGTPEEQHKQLRHHPFVPVRPVARLAMTRARFEELREVMNGVVKTWPPTT